MDCGFVGHAAAFEKGGDKVGGHGSGLIGRHDRWNLSTNSVEEISAFLGVKQGRLIDRIHWLTRLPRNILLSVITVALRTLGITANAFPRDSESPRIIIVIVFMNYY